jgi:site-specific DNA-methyltransferase (adenine-specific)
MELDKIYNMDCLEGMRQMEAESVDLTVTSPPYDNLRDYGDVGDGWCFDAFTKIAAELYRITKDGGVVVWNVKDATINGSETGTSFRQALYFMECGFKLHDTMIWEKDTFTFPQKTTYRDVFEYMFVFAKGKISTFNLIADRRNVTAGQTVHGTERRKDGTTQKKTCCGNITGEYGVRFNVWQIPGEKNNETGHPAVFPYKLALDHIRTWPDEEMTVLDPFMGSGTTAIACHRSKRHFIGFELSKEYFDKACKRIDNEQRQLTLF